VNVVVGELTKVCYRKKDDVAIKIEEEYLARLEELKKKINFV